MEFLLGQGPKLVRSKASTSLLARNLHHSLAIDKPPGLFLLMKQCPKEAWKSVIMILVFKFLKKGYAFSLKFSIRLSTVLEIWEMFYKYLFIPGPCSTKELN